MSRKKKPWYRLRNIALFLVGAIVVWAGYWVWWAMTAVPTLSVDYAQRLGEVSAAAQPEGENAWPHLMEICAVIEQLEIDFPEDDRPSPHTFGIEYTLLYDRDLDSGGSPESDAFIERVLDHVEAAGIYEMSAKLHDCPRMVRDWPTDGQALIGILLPELAQARSFTKLRVASMRRAAREGDGGEVVNAITDITVLADHVTHEPILISWLVGAAIHHAGTEEIRRLARAGQLDQETLERVIDVLADARPASPALAFDGERGFMMDMIQRVYTDDGNGNGRLLPSELDNFNAAGLGGTPTGELSRLRNLFGVFSPNRANITARANEMYDRMIAFTSMPYERRSREMSDLDDEIQNLGPGYALLQLLIPSFGKVVNTYPQMVATIDATRLTAAIELHRLRTGTLPATLDELESLFPEGLPVDPYHGGAYGYRITSDSYIVYTFGYDATDDEGKMDGDKAIRGRNKGVDFVFE